METGGKRFNGRMSVQVNDDLFLAVLARETKLKAEIKSMREKLNIAITALNYYVHDDIPEYRNPAIEALKKIVGEK
jgi:hypothetical protein